MRLFVAVDLDEGVLKRVAAMQQQLRDALALPGGQVKWVRPDQMHLTLKFLGAVADDDITRICAMAQETASRHAGFELTCRGIGVFGRPARVVWVGADGGEAMMSLQHDLEERFAKAGWATEHRPFSAHLTLCRVKSAKAAHALTAAIGPYAEEDFGSAWVDAMTVYDSRLSSAGPDYAVVNRTKLIEGSGF